MVKYPTKVFPTLQDRGMEAMFSRLKEGDLFGRHHSVVCILNRVGIGKSRHRFEIREEDLFGRYHLVGPLNPK